AGSHLDDEVHDTFRVQAVGRHVWMQRRRYASFLGPDVQTALWVVRRTPLDARATVGAIQGHVALIFRDPLGPAGLQQQSPATLQSQESSREVLDIERAWLHTGLAHERRR